MTNFQKRILTSLIVLPLSFFFIVKGGYYLLFFLMLIFFIANYELFSVFTKKITILFIDLILILALFSIYLLGDTKEVSLKLLILLLIIF